MNERQKLLRRIQTLDFALDELTLYLDTHPDCPEGLAQYSALLPQYRQAMSEYSARFGPLTSEDNDSTERWRWVDAPWPWQMER